MTTARQNFVGKLVTKKKCIKKRPKRLEKTVLGQMGHFGNTDTGHLKFLHFEGLLRRGRVSKIRLEEGDRQ